MKSIVSKIFRHTVMCLILMPFMTSQAQERPVADFFATPLTGWNDYFRPEFVSLSTGHITDYQWDFGDGSTSADPAPNHQYTEAGFYSIQLIVTGPGGSDTLRNENYIDVKDFSEYPYPTYIIGEPVMAVWDSLMDVIQASQLPGPDPADPAWWGSNINFVRHGGGGRILFGFSNDTIFVNHDRDFFGDNLIIDGEDKNVHFYYNGPDNCDQTEGQDALLRMHGNDNIFRNVHFDRFPEGVHNRGGRRNLIENVAVNIICEDAMTMNGGGYYVMDGIIRNCVFLDSEDKTIMVNNGGGTMVVRGCYSENGNQPVRMTGRGLMVVRHCDFTGPRNNGPRFGGKENLVIFENNHSFGTKSGLRLSDNVNAIVRHNVMEDCTQYGVRIYKDSDGARIRMENNIIRNNPTGVYVEKMARVDLGGGNLDVHGSGYHTGPGAARAASTGLNTVMESGAFDLLNKTSRSVMAESNIWDHKTVDEVLGNDVSGLADVDPLHPLSSTPESGSTDQPVPALLIQSYPNPFNGRVNFKIDIPATGKVHLNVYDARGRHINSLAGGGMRKGVHTLSWEGADQDGRPVATGLYIVRLIHEAAGSTRIEIKEHRILYIK